MSRVNARVYINGRFLTQRVTGVQRYAEEILRQIDLLLDSVAPDLECVVLCPPGARDLGLKRIRVKTVGLLGGHIWEQTFLWWASWDAPLISFTSTGPIFKRSQAITIHDASVYRVSDSFSWRFRAWYKFVIHMIAVRSPVTMVVSRFSEKEAVRFFRVPSDRIVVTSAGWQHLAALKPDRNILKRYGLENRAFVLAVSSPTSNKNFGVVVHAANQMIDSDVTFVFVGQAEGAVFGSAKLESTDRVQFLGYVSDEELKALYEAAACFVFPSRYEGFGIPPLEALSCGCRVVASRIEAVQEVCADAVVYFDPSDATDLRQKLEFVIQQGKSGRAETDQVAQSRLSMYSWELGGRRCLSAALALQ